jgi:hypothetical protein
LETRLDLVIWLLIEWADLDADRTAVIAIKIREADLILNICFTAIGTDDWFIKNGIRWAIPDANVTLIAKIPNPLVMIAFIPG